jgi:hypothetical protein
MKYFLIFLIFSFVSCNSPKNLVKEPTPVNYFDGNEWQTGTLIDFDKDWNAVILTKDSFKIHVDYIDYGVSIIKNRNWEEELKKKNVR